MTRLDPKLREAAIGLRIRNRASAEEISKVIPADKATIALWLRAYPLTKEEVRARRAIGALKCRSIVAQKKTDRPRRCPKCGALGPFNDNPRARRCVPCLRADARESYKKNAEQRKAVVKEYYLKNKEAINTASKEAYAKEKGTPKRDRRRAKALSRKYGLDSEDVYRRLEAQGGLCGVCTRPLVSGRGTQLDHDHVTGKIRAFLCNKCNTALAMVSDDLLVAHSLYEYLLLHTR